MTLLTYLLKDVPLDKAVAINEQVGPLSQAVRAAKI